MAFPFEIPLAEMNEVGKPVALPASQSVPNPFSGGFAVRIESRVPGSVQSPLHVGQGGEFVVAFSSICTHMGCLLGDILDHRSPTVTAEERLVGGPCPCHGTTFDLLRSGLVVLGPATQHLPQLKLELTSTATGLQATGWLNDTEPRFEEWPTRTDA